MAGLSIGIEALYQRSWWVLFAFAGALAALPSAAGEQPALEVGPAVARLPAEAARG